MPIEPQPLKYSVTIRLSLQEAQYLNRLARTPIEPFCRIKVSNALSNFERLEQQLEPTLPISFFLNRRDYQQLVETVNNSAIESFCRQAIFQQVETSREGSSIGQQHSRSVKKIKTLSTICLIVGGLLVASNTSISKFGFLFLALSSSSMALACFLAAEKMNARFFVLTFLIVDCFGIFNWLIRS